MEHVAAAPTGRRLARRPQLHQHLAVGGAELIVRQLARVPFDLIGDAQLLENPHDLVVEVDRTREGVRRRVLVDGDHAHAALGEQSRQHRPDRPKPDHQHLAVEGRRAHAQPIVGGGGGPHWTPSRSCTLATFDPSAAVKRSPSVQCSSV